MSYNRKNFDKQKRNNLAAKHDFNRGGFHENTHKQDRNNIKKQLREIEGQWK